MSDPIEFTTSSPRHGLALLFAGQSQKEFYVNEAHSLLDALLHISIEGESNDPPASPAEGETWLVDDTPTGDWVGHAGELASWQSANWLYATPTIGMQLFDKASGQLMRFDGTWRKAATVADPTGGTTTDAEARTAIAGLIDALIEAGILPDS